MSATETDVHIVERSEIEKELVAGLAASLGPPPAGEKSTGKFRSPKLPPRIKTGLVKRQGRHVLKGYVPKAIRVVATDDATSPAEPGETERFEKTVSQAVDMAMTKTLGSSARYVAIDSDDPLVQQSVVSVIERVPEIVHARRDQISQANIDLLVDNFLRTEPTASARAEIELDNARERALFREQVPCYTSRQVAELAGHGATNASATTSRWKKAGRIFGVPWKDGDLYPAFQFEEGRPRGIIARVLAALPARMTPWQTAFWLTSGNSWLDGATPASMLDAGDAVVAAAEREAESVIG